jgi:hypothetical protein
MGSPAATSGVGVTLGLGVTFGVGGGVSVGVELAVGVSVGVGLLVGVPVGVCIRTAQPPCSSAPIESLASKALLNKRIAAVGTRSNRRRFFMNP